MKNILSVLFLFISCTVFGQLQKGNLLIGGSLGFNGSKDETPTTPSYNDVSKSTSIDINPRIGWFLSDRSVLGVEPGYSFKKDTYDNTDNKSTNKSYTFSIRPFYRYYFPIGDKFAFYLHGRAGVSFGKSNKNFSYLNPDTGLLTSSNQKYDITGGEVSASPGIAFFLSPKLSIETTISSVGYQYNEQKAKSGENVTSSAFSFQYNAFSFGVTWYLKK